MRVVQVQTYYRLEKYEETEYFCPHCGCKPTFIAKNGGDYNLGEECICATCAGTFYGEYNTEATKRSLDEARRIREQLKELQ